MGRKRGHCTGDLESIQDIWSKYAAVSENWDSLCLLMFCDRSMRFRDKEGVWRNMGMRKKKLPIGIENFEELRSEDFYYIDKTGLIRE